jgi:hypothetical protein
LALKQMGMHEQARVEFAKWRKLYGSMQDAGQVEILQRRVQ